MLYTNVCFRFWLNYDIFVWIQYINIMFCYSLITLIQSEPIYIMFFSFQKLNRTSIFGKTAIIYYLFMTIVCVYCMHMYIQKIVRCCIWSIFTCRFLLKLSLWFAGGWLVWCRLSLGITGSIIQRSSRLDGTALTVVIKGLLDICISTWLKKERRRRRRKYTVNLIRSNAKYRVLVLKG